ncbi:MAG: ATP-binding protein [Nanoarchaeota archaeon]|nr:ATP-binding protein [Nanoarchaeota archaeon]
MGGKTIKNTEKNINRFAMSRLKTDLDAYLSILDERMAQIDEKCPKFDTRLFLDSYDFYLTHIKRLAPAALDEELYNERDKGLSSILYEKLRPNILKVREFRKWVIDQRAPDDENNPTHDWGYQNSLGEKVEEAFFDNALHSFFTHDVNHLTLDSFSLFSNVFGGLGLPKVNEYYTGNRADIEDTLNHFNEKPADFLREFVEPYKMLNFMVENELNLKHKKEDFSPKQLAKEIAITLKFRNYFMEYAIVDSFSKTDKNEICLDVEDFELKGNSGCVWSIMYNLSKNSIKKFEEEAEGKHDQNKKVFIQAYEAPRDSYVITVGDNGSGIDFNKMKKLMIDTIKEKGIDSLVFPNNSSKKRVRAWQDSPYKYGDMKISDITDIAFMARMSGFDNSTHFSSGLGLYGLQYLTKELGGKMLYGETKDGSPLFTIILPKAMPESRMKKYISDVQIQRNYNEMKNCGSLTNVA